MAINTALPSRNTLLRARKSSRLRPWRIVMYLILIALAVMFGFPLFWTLMSSLKTAQEMYDFPPRLFPHIPQIANYVRVLSIERIPVLLWTFNSMLITVLTTLGTVITCSLVGYSFARFEFRGRGFLFFLTLATLTLPAQVTLIPQFVLFYKLGWINTHFPLWVPAWFGGGAFGIFLMNQFFKTIPRDLDEAALIDGASYPRVFWSVLLPLLKPPLASLSIITFLGSWNDFLWPLIVVNKGDLFTLPVGMTVFTQPMQSPYWTYIMAVSTVATLPVVFVFLFLQKYFIQGVVLSGLKG